MCGYPENVHDNEGGKYYQRYAYPLSISNWQTYPECPVTIDYEHCIPSGRAFLATANPDATRTAVRSLKNAVIGGHLIIPRPVPDIQHERGRGSRGRIEAGERGIINGSGPNAGLASSDEGRTVVIAGLPANISPDRLRLYFKSFNIATSEKGQLDIIRVEP